jgi:cytochrome c
MAATPDFTYSPALQAMGGVWSFDKLNYFLKKPKDMIPKTKMNFNGLSKVQDRANLIAYLRQQADSPVAIPAQ